MHENNGILAEINDRRSYRAISNKPVETKIVERLLKAASLAPY
ncbi:MAG: hypothetical protein PF693_11315 [Spirochaetia bacterium]|jgi:nitroreductase|nr:hypothetical protein [Spirochaetia bacterium]